MQKLVVSEAIRVALGGDLHLLRRVNDKVVRERKRAQKKVAESESAQDWYEEQSAREHEFQARHKEALQRRQQSSSSVDETSVQLVLSF